MIKENSPFTKLIYLYCIISSMFIDDCIGFNCPLPKRCRLAKVYYKRNLDFNEKIRSKHFGIMCDVKYEEFEFQFNEPDLTLIASENKHICDLNIDLHIETIIFRWVSKGLNT